MTLNDAVNLIYTDGNGLIVYVFDDEEYRDLFRKSGSDEGLLFVIRSQFKLNNILKEKYANAHVTAIFLVDVATVDVIINPEE